MKLNWVKGDMPVAAAVRQLKLQQKCAGGDVSLGADSQAVARGFGLRSSHRHFSFLLSFQFFLAD
jgi:hypothetical protein